jgi:hypothetical protein
VEKKHASWDCRMPAILDLEGHEVTPDQVALVGLPSTMAGKDSLFTKRSEIESRVISFKRIVNVEQIEGNGR